MIDQTDTDCEPVMIKAGETTTLAWQVWVQDAPVAAPWQARCKIVAALGGTVLESPACTIADGCVMVPFTEAETTAFAWQQGVIGVEVYDSTVSPEVAYRVVQAPVTVSPQVIV